VKTTNGHLFLKRLLAARKAAWLAFPCSILVQALTYFAYLGLSSGGSDGLIASGLYGKPSREKLTMATLS